MRNVEKWWICSRICLKRSGRRRRRKNFPSPILHAPRDNISRKPYGVARSVSFTTTTTTIMVLEEALHFIWIREVQVPPNRNLPWDTYNDTGIIVWNLSEFLFDLNLLSLVTNDWYVGVSIFLRECQTLHTHTHMEVILTAFGNDFTRPSLGKGNV